MIKRIDIRKEEGEYHETQEIFAGKRQRLRPAAVIF